MPPIFVCIFNLYSQFCEAQFNGLLSVSNLKMHVKFTVTDLPYLQLNDVSSPYHGRQLAVITQNFFEYYSKYYSLLLYFLYQLMMYF